MTNSGNLLTAALSSLARARTDVHQGAYAGSAPLRWAATLRMTRGMLSAAVTSLIVSVLLPFALLVTRGRKLLLAILILNVPFRIGAHLFYQEDLGDLGANGGLDVSVSTVALVALYAAWVIQLLSSKDCKPPAPRLDWGLGLYFVFASISLLAANNVQLAAFELFSLFQAVLVYIYVASWTRTRNDVVFILRLLLLGLLLEGSLIIGLGITGKDFNVAGLKTDVDTEGAELGRLPRVGGTGSPNGTAGYIIMFFAPAISVLFTRAKRSLKWLATLACAISGVALVLTFSRGGWIGCTLSVLVLLVVGSGRIRISRKVIVGLAAVLVLVSIAFRTAIANRLFQSDEGAAQSRVPLIWLSVRMIEDNPELGVGVNNFPVRMQEYAAREMRGQWLYTVHNKYLLTWAETGLGGLLAFVWFLASSIRKGWQCWEKREPILSPLALGFTSAMIGIMAHMLFDVFREPVYLWVGTALIAAMWHQTRMRGLHPVATRNIQINPLTGIS